MRALVVLLCSALFCGAAILHVPCTQDTTLSEAFALNNLGALQFVNAGTTQSGRKNRALLRFELRGTLPPGSQIRAVNLVLECTGVPDEPSPFSDFGLHRMLKPWGEGQGVSPTNCTSCAGQGSQAVPGEACWTVPGPSPMDNWDAPGAGGALDHVPSPSTSTTIYGVGDSPYLFFSNPALLADVLQWVAAPERNYGWMLKCATENVPLSARRFGSRESGTPAYLDLDILMPPADLSITVSAGVAEITFTTEPEQSYSVESAPWLTGPWSTLTNIPAAGVAGTASIADPATGQTRYYRVSSR